MEFWVKKNSLSLLSSWDIKCIILSSKNCRVFFRVFHTKLYCIRTSDVFFIADFTQGSQVHFHYSALLDNFLTMSRKLFYSDAIWSSSNTCGVDPGGSSIFLQWTFLHNFTPNYFSSSSDDIINTWKDWQFEDDSC